jgi:2-C-methyl-D-erythritol 4-phosphate cytidylyltransferase
VTLPSCAAIVTAAGTSARMGGTAACLKKEYRPLDGIPVLARALLPFLSPRRFTPLVVTVPPGDLERARALLAPHVPLDGVTFVEGGATRQDSVLRALCAIAPASPELVLIHDGARPWVSAALIESVAQSAALHAACVPLLAASEALKEVSGGPWIQRHLERTAIHCAQTPQGFSFARILAAHQEARAAGCRCSDDGEIFDRFDGPVAWVTGDPRNRKITWEHDLPGSPEDA